MKLALITDRGEIVTVVEGIEGYNLTSSLARAAVCGDIAMAVEKLQAQEQENPPRVG